MSDIGDEQSSGPVCALKMAMRGTAATSEQAAETHPVTFFPRTFAALERLRVSTEELRQAALALRQQHGLRRPASSSDAADGSAATESGAS